MIISIKVERTRLKSTMWRREQLSHMTIIGFNLMPTNFVRKISTLPTDFTPKRYVFWEHNTKLYDFISVSFFFLHLCAVCLCVHTQANWVIIMSIWSLWSMISSIELLMQCQTVDTLGHIIFRRTSQLPKRSILACFSHFMVPL